MGAQCAANGLNMVSTLINTSYQSFVTKCDERRNSLCVPPGQSVADGGWDVIIIELKQYLQAITSCSFDPGPRILDPIYLARAGLAAAVTSGQPRPGQHKIKPK